MTEKTKKVLTFCKEYGIITLGLLGYVLGWILFLIPNNMIGGGVTGISSIIQYATGIKMGYSYFTINTVLLITAFFILGKGFGGKTIFAIIFTSICLNVGQGLIPDDIVQILAIENGKLMCTIMGGILSGVGIGMAISQGGSTGGTDIIALIVNKYRNVSPGRMILLIDVFIMIFSLFLPSYMADGSRMPWADKITTVVYGLILVVVTSTVLDLYLSGSRQSVQVTVFSKRYAEIADTITNDFHRGVTVLDGKGWYTKDSVPVLMVITRKTDLNILLRYINSVDSNAFISVASVTGVYGKGFDTIKQKARKKQIAQASNEKTEG